MTSKLTMKSIRRKVALKVPFQRLKLLYSVLLQQTSITKYLCENAFSSTLQAGIALHIEDLFCYGAPNFLLI